MILLMALAATALGAFQAPQSNDRGISHQESTQKDSADKMRLTNVDQMARRVDSLQFIVVYNAQLLRRDLDSKVVWIYVMLGIMIIASMMMYGALNQAQRQRKDLEERVFNTISSSMTELEAKIKRIKMDVDAHSPPKRSAAPRKKKL